MEYSLKKLIKFFFTEIPPCGIYKSWSAWGYEYDCEYKPECTCEECICNHELGGKIDPRTNKKFRRYSKRVSHGNGKRSQDDYK